MILRLRITPSFGSNLPRATRLTIPRWNSPSDALPLAEDASARSSAFFVPLTRGKASSFIARPGQATFATMPSRALIAFRSVLSPFSMKLQSYFGSPLSRPCRSLNLRASWRWGCSSTAGSLERNTPPIGSAACIFIVISFRLIPLLRFVQSRVYAVVSGLSTTFGEAQEPRVSRVSRVMVVNHNNWKPQQLARIERAILAVLAAQENLHRGYETHFIVMHHYPQTALHLL